MTKTSHKKNRPFDFKLIDLVEPHTVLYLRRPGLSTFEVMKSKNIIWSQIAEDMGSTVDFCIMRWNNLRGQFQKELRRCRELCPKEGIIRGSHWPYLDRLRFLENTIKFNRTKKTRTSKRAVKRKQEEQEQIIHESSDSDDDSSHKLAEADSSDIVEDLVDEIFIEENSYEDADDITEDTDLHNVMESNQREEQPPQQLQNTEQISASNLERMASLLMGIEGENRLRCERRIMAFLCKCQLRALSREGVDDLVV